MIIIAEDEPDQRLALRLALQKEGYPVREAASGAEALSLIAQKAPRALITDIFMPDMDGLELITQVRDEFPDVRIIVVSGGGKRTSGDYFASTRVLGAHATLQKPLDFEQLVTILRSLP
jgi:CheY-like chemotaxis protein